jgi:hypothetical protein
MAATMKEIKKFMEEGTNGRKCTVLEMKALSPDDRTELKTLLEEEAA